MADFDFRFQIRLVHYIKQEKINSILTNALAYREIGLSNQKSKSAFRDAKKLSFVRYQLSKPFNPIFFIEN